MLENIITLSKLNSVFVEIATVIRSGSGAEQNCDEATSGYPLPPQRSVGHWIAVMNLLFNTDAV